ncbi:MAG: F0F1 ATP synthase subunit epsilon [Candidatus Cloacimonetes bacterium]|nr:F0F1 ATP synthase subunit epsilon [Candidatus Cloacimonadota bacterium]
MANNKLHLRITTPRGILLEQDITEVTAPGKEGYFGILQGHTPFLTSLGPGIMTVYDNKSKQEFSVHSGFLTIDNNEVNVITNKIEKPKEIDKSRAKKARERAEKRLREQKEETDMRRAEAALRRAVARLKVAK